MLIRRADWTTQRWKNGHGITREIWRFRAPDRATDAPADTFDLRLSVAEIEGAQPFSLFPGIYRTLIPLEDTTLTFGSQPMVKYHCFQFPGDTPTETRGEGHASDLNVMTPIERRAHVEVSALETHRYSPDIWPITRVRNLAVFALEKTTLRKGRGPDIELERFDTLIELSTGDPIEHTASSSVVWIRF